jgi:hypothetical protein
MSLDQLHALQPNLHNNLDHLPPHIDSPLNDGFGVIIVTICVYQSAQILLLSNENNKSYLFEGNEGDVYILSGKSRNDYDHGVICELEKRKKNKLIQSNEIKIKKPKNKNKYMNNGRESLNLRFSIHGNKPDLPYYVYDEMPDFISGSSSY